MKDIYEITDNSNFFKLATKNNTSYGKEFNIFYKKYRHDLISLDINKLTKIYEETGIRVNHYFYPKNDYNPILLKRNPHIIISHNSLIYSDKYCIYDQETSKRINEFENYIENSLDGYDLDSDTYLNSEYFSEYFDSDLNIHTFVDKIGIDKHNLDNEINEFIFIEQDGKKKYISNKPIKNTY